MSFSLPDEREGATPHFDNDRLEEFIARYQSQGDAASLGEIVRLTQTRARTRAEI